VKTKRKIPVAIRNRAPAAQYTPSTANYVSMTSREYGLFSAAENIKASGIYPTQMYSVGVSAARASGGTDNKLRRWPGCSEFGP